MLKDAQRCADDLGAIARAVFAPNKPITPCSAETAQFLARTTAAEVLSALAAAALRGADVGAAVADILRSVGAENGIHLEAS